MLSLWLNDNDLTGPIPDLSTLTKLETLYLWRNKLTGGVPATLPASLTQVLLFGNRLTGTIPDLSGLTALTGLYLDGNDLHGSIPTTLPTSLTTLRLAANGFTGSLAALNTLTSLTALSLCANDFPAGETLPTALANRVTAESLTVHTCVGIEDAQAFEGEDLSFALEYSTWPVRGGTPRGNAIYYRLVDGTATSPADFTVPVNPDNASLFPYAALPAVAAGETEATVTITVPTVADGVSGEGAETLQVELGADRYVSGLGRYAVSWSYFTRRFATGTILPPPPRVSFDSVQVGTHESQGTVSFELQLSDSVTADTVIGLTWQRPDPSGGFQHVRPATRGTSCSAGVDLVAPASVTARPAHGTSVGIEVTVCDDAIAEPAEAIDVVIQADTNAEPVYKLGSRARTSVFFPDDDDKVSFGWTQTTRTVREGTTVNLPVAVTGAFEGTVRIDVSDGLRETATRGEDWRFAKCVVRGGASSATCPIVIVADQVTDGGETTTLTLVPIGDAQLESEVTGDALMLTIQDGATPPPSTDATLSGLTATSSDSASGTFGALTLTPSVFAAGTTAYTASVANSITHVKLTPTVNHSAASVEVGKQGQTLTTVSSGTASAAIALAEGANPITVKVTAQDGTSTETYTVTVTRAGTPGNPTTVTLTASSTSPAEGTTVTLTAELDQAALAGGHGVTLVATVPAGSSATLPPDSGADIRFDGDFQITQLSTQLAEGEKTATFEVEIVDDTEEEAAEAIEFEVAVALSATDFLTASTTLTIPASDGPGTTPSTDATLSGLTATSSDSASGTFSSLNIGTFAASTTSYTASVANSITHVKLAPTVNHASASVEVGKQGQTLTAVSSGTASAAIALSVGANPITVKVTAQDGTSTETYTVTVTRASPPVTVNLSATPNPVTEGGQVFIKATLSKSLSNQNIPITVTLGSAESSDIGAVVPTVIRHAAGTSTSIHIQTNQDADTDDETFTVALGNLPSGLTAGTESSVTVTITDDDAAGVTVSQSSLSVAEGATATYTVVLRTEPTTNYVRVTPTSGTPAKASVSGTVEFTTANWHRPQEITVTGVAAGTSRITHAATSDDSSYQGISIADVSVTVTETPARPALSFASAAYSTEETSPAGVTVTVNIAPPLAQASRVDVTRLAGSTATPTEDYVMRTQAGLSSGALRLPENSATVSFTIEAIFDSKTEGDEYVDLELTAIANAPYDIDASSNSARVTIVDDSLTPTPGPPRNLTVTPGDGELTLGWDSPATRIAGLVGYEIQYKEDGAPDVDATGKNPATGWVSDRESGRDPVYRRHTITGLSNGTTYDLRVRIMEVGLNGEWATASGTPSATATTCTATDTAVTGASATLIADCSVLLGLKATLEGDTVSLNWNKGRAMALWDGVNLNSAGDRVEQLRLARSGLGGTIPPSLNDLTGLAWLELEWNGLTGTIPDLSALTGLTRLFLAGNDIGGGIPATLGSLTNLGHLALCETILTGGLPAGLESRRTSGSLQMWSCLVMEDAEAVEGQEMRFELTHSTWPVRGGNALTLSYRTEDGTATGGADFEAETSGSVTVPAITSSETSASAAIVVKTLADTIAEGPETFRVKLQAAGSMGTGSMLRRNDAAVGTIRDDDAPSRTPPSPPPPPPPPPPGASDATLGELGLSAGWLALVPETTDYAMALPYGVASLTLAPTVADPGATVTVNGVEVSSGEPGAVIALPVGETLIEVVVTARNGATRTYTVTVTRAPAEVALLPGASSALWGFVRIVNESDEAGEVQIRAFDDAGEEYGPLTLALEAGAAVQLSANDLESGNPDKGLTGSTGPGQGRWRLVFESELAFRALGYVRTRGAQGFPNAVHDVVAESQSAQGYRYEVVFFNPASNPRQASVLRLVNRSDTEAAVRITGTDDAGRAGEAAVTLRLPAQAARRLSAPELESGEGEGLGGMLGDGAGKWRLRVDSDRPLSVMSLMRSLDGHLTNLSTAPSGVERLWLLPSAANAVRYGFVRLVNESDAAGEVRIRAFDDAGEEYAPLTLALEAGAAVRLSSNDFESGNPDKGLTGSTGPGQVRWRLAFESELDLRVLGYLRKRGAAGFPHAVHDVVAQSPSAEGYRYEVVFFNPASNTRQASVLLLVNRSASEAAAVRITGTDDAGRAGEAAVTLTLPAGASRRLWARALESGEGEGLDGALGDGAGKWRLRVESDRPLGVMSLMRSTDLHLTNLSTAPPASR